MIYIKTHKLKNHKYKITKCITKKEKIYIYIISKYANYRDNHQVTIFKYPKK